MAEAVAIRTAGVAFARDLVELGKPRVTLLVIFTTAIGLWLAPGSLGGWRTALFLAATSVLVASANTLNCYIERDSDGRMIRTRQRPLPAGRLSPPTAIVWGVLQGGAALVALWFLTNPLTFTLGAIALVSYVLVYTPLKRVTPWALHIGAVPGAIPPLMGWTAATGSLAVPGWTVFAILFAWQLPHFVAISLYLEEDYARGGLRVLPIAFGEDAARRHLLAYSVGVLVVTLAAVPLGVAGPIYGVVAAVLGARMIWMAWDGVRRRAGGAWARRFFLYTIVHLSVLVTALLLDAR